MRFDKKGSPISRALIGHATTYENTKQDKMKEALMQKMRKKVVTKVKAKNFALLALGNIMGSEKS